MTTDVELTDKQEAIVRFIAQHIDELGYQPSLREMMAHFNIKSPNGIAAHLKALERKGVLLVNRRASRAIIFAYKEWL